jgi:hypothetical protein
MLNLSVGGLAGAISILVTYPTDLVRRRMQMRGQGGYDNYKNMLDCFKTITIKEGPLALYGGLNACLLKVIPAMAIMFMCNEQLKKMLDV